MDTPLLVSYVALWAVVLFQSLVMVGLLAVVSQLRRSGGTPQSSVPLPGLAPGTSIPAFSARDLEGRRIQAADLLGKMTAVLFVSPSCSTCVTTLDEMVGLSHKARGNIVVVCQGDRKKCAEVAATYGLLRTIPDPEGQISELFRVGTVPTAVLVDRAGKVQSYGQPARAPALEGLLMNENVDRPALEGAAVV